MEEIKVLSLNDKTEWEQYITKLPIHLQDVYFTYDLYRTAAEDTKSDAHCFIYTLNDDLYVYPFLRSKISSEYIQDTTYYDIEGAYGYNGPVSTSTEPKFLKSAHTFFLKYCSEQNIIAEFTRFNPVLKNHEFAAYMNVVKVNENVILDLSEENIWMNAYEHSTRKNVNKAIRSGLGVSHTSGKDISTDEFEKFLDIYYQTMDRNQAGSQYYFKKEFFENLCNINGGSSLFFFTRTENKIVSAELVLVGPSIGYSFLGGTLPDYFGARANDILKDEIIKTLKNNGLQYFCLGGGTTLNDGIFKYKKCFAKNGVSDFFIGKKIHNPVIYQQVVSAWENKNEEKALLYKHHLLKYKY